MADMRLEVGIVIGLVPLYRRNGRLAGWAQVDASDVEAVLRHHWHLDASGYPARLKSERLHRFLVDVPDGYVVDHINRDKLDNRLSNLRVVTQQVNTQNTPGDVTGGSRYRGVYLDRRRGIWYAQVKHNGVRHHGGCFRSEVEAAAAAERLRAAVFGTPAVVPTVRREHAIPPRQDPSKCIHGHLWAENTYVNPQGHRTCRTCSREAGRRYYERRYLRDAA